MSNAQEALTLWHCCCLAIMTTLQIGICFSFTRLLATSDTNCALEHWIKKRVKAKSISRESNQQKSCCLSLLTGMEHDLLAALELESGYNTL